MLAGRCSARLAVNLEPLKSQTHMEKFVMAAGTAVRYADAGKGTQAVLLLHGYLESIEVWDDFAGQLGTSYRVLRLALPGHAFSDWGGPEVIALA